MGRRTRGEVGRWDGQWVEHADTAYALLPAPAGPSRRAVVLKSVRENLPAAIGLALRVVFVAIAVPLILLFAVASVGAMIWGRGW